MDAKKLTVSKSRSTLFFGLTGVIACINILLLTLGMNVNSAIALLRTERQQLKEQENVINQTTDVMPQYDQFAVLSENIFPNELTLVSFISTFETIAREYAITYTPVKLTSQSPVNENERLFLLFTFSMRTTWNKYLMFLQKLQEVPYMIQPVSQTIKMPDGFGDSSIEIGLQFKLYVQNPFTN